MLVDGWATEFFGGGNNRPTFPFIAIPKEDCVGSSPTVKKRIASFLVPGYKTGLGAKCALSLFYLCRKCPRKSWHLFLVPLCKMKIPPYPGGMFV